MDCPPEAGGALQAWTLAQELLPVFPWVGALDGAVEPVPTFAVALSAIALPGGAGTPSSWLELKRLPGTESAHRPVRVALQREKILENHFTGWSGKVRGNVFVFSVP
jgi:hypothetical protein